MKRRAGRGGASTTELASFFAAGEFSPFEAHGQRQPLDKIPNGVFSNSQELLNLIVILIITKVVLITE